MLNELMKEWALSQHFIERLNNIMMYHVLELGDAELKQYQEYMHYIKYMVEIGTTTVWIMDFFEEFMPRIMPIVRASHYAAVAQLHSVHDGAW